MPLSPPQLWRHSMKQQYSEYYQPPVVPLRTWSAGLYIRLSREDELKGESNSISSQREILREFLKQHPDVIEYDCYVDDGWTGTNFDRPGFQRMMQDIYAGRVNCVIVKDLSRFGRNANRGGALITEEFVRLGVRFIACNNYYDSLTASPSSAATNCITLGITNVINESVSATTSVNVRATLNVNRQQGKFIGSFPTYGYLKDPEDHHKLIVDQETAPVVKLIFEKFIQGRSIIGIAKDLNEMGIPNPSAYKKLQGMNYQHTCKNLDGLWPDSSVRRILQNEMYTGKMVQGKNRVISYKDQVCRACPKEEWFVVEGTHEAIISQDVFDQAQQLFCHSIRRSPRTGETDLFAGLVRCAKCGRIMNKKTNRHEYGTYEYYRCATARKMKKNACGNRTIRIDQLEEAVITYLRYASELAAGMGEVLDRIAASHQRQRKSSHLEKTLQTQTAEREKCAKVILDLYPDWKSGVLTREEYMTLKAATQERMDALDGSIAQLQKSIDTLNTDARADNTFLRRFRELDAVSELSRPLVTELIDTILVHEDRQIEIIPKHADVYAAVLEYVEANKEAALTPARAG